MGWQEERDKAIVEFFNNVTNPEEIVSHIKDDPGFGIDSPRAYGIRLSLARYILTERDKRPGKKFSAVGEIDSIKGVGIDTLNDIYFSLQPPSYNYPVLLFPVRLETRFKDHELWIRIYPDDISIETLRRTASPVEVAALHDYHRELASAQTQEKKITAWQRLSQRFGQKRAAWLEQHVDDVLNFKNEAEVPVVRTLPDRFLVCAYKGTDCVYSKLGNIIPGQLPLIVNSLNQPDVNNPLYDNDAKWIWDFETAVDKGMAVKISLTQDDDGFFSRIIAVGLNRRQTHFEGQNLVGELMENHRYTNGFSFIPYGTPTNNTQRVKSGYAKTINEPLTTHNTSSTGLSWTNGHELAGALGLPLDTFTGIENSELGEPIHTKNLHDVLWLALGDYYLAEMFPNTLDTGAREAVWNLFRDYVRARGALPAIRVGKQPYGILPVASVEDWQPSEHDSGLGLTTSSHFDSGLHRILKNLYDLWLAMAEKNELVPCIGTSGDTDEELLKILAMAPGAISHAARSIVDERFIAWLINALRKHFYGNDAEFWVMRWAFKWIENKQGALQTLSYLVNGVAPPPDALANSIPLRLFNWGQAMELPISLARDEATPDDPLWYLPLFGTGNVTIGDRQEPRTLLFDLLRRALNYQGKFSQPIPAAEGRIRVSVDKIINSGVSCQDIETQLKDILDLHTHRLDAWLTSFAVRRLKAIRSQKGQEQGIYVGAYGWVENLQRANRATHVNATHVNATHVNATQAGEGGYIYAPSLGQAAAGAVLRNAYLSHNDDANGNLFRLNLSSRRVKNALKLMEGLRQGQELGILLGFQFERGLHDQQKDVFIDLFRSAYPLVAHQETAASAGESAETVAARNVADGLKIVKDWRENTGALRNAIGQPLPAEVEAELNRLVDTIDGMTDLLLYESAYQSVQGNYERCGAALNAASGIAQPPEIESIRSKSSGLGLAHKVCLIFNKESMTHNGPREKAEPTLAFWFSKILGDMAQIGCTAHIINYLDATGKPYSPLNLNEASQAELETLPGMDAAMAQAIISYRDANGAFDRISSLLNINNIDESMLDMLKGLVTVNPLVVNLAQLNLGPLDFLYLSQTAPQNAETELEQRLKFYVRKENYLDANCEISLDFSRLTTVFTRSMSEALEVSRYVLDCVTSGSNLYPETFLHPEVSTQQTFTAESYQELYQRVSQAQMSLQTLSDLLSQPGVSPEAGLFMELSRYGIEGTILPCPFRDPEQEARLTSVLKIIQQRLTKSTALIQEAQRISDPSFLKPVKTLIEAMKIIFGDSFTILPIFTIPDSSQFQQAVTPGYQNMVLGKKNPERIYLWLQQAAQTHPALQRLEDMLMFTDAWKTAVVTDDGYDAPLEEISNTNPLVWRVMQLPFDAKFRWLAMSVEELTEGLNQTELQAWNRRLAEEGLPRGISSLVCLVPQNIDFSRQITGIMVDQWDEFLPSKLQTTGIGFQYDSPNAQAPQALLLAVPPKMIHDRAPAREGWTHQDILHIVKDTMDLAKVRAVDLDAFQAVGRFTPALFLPTDPARPGWEREITALMCADFDKYAVNSMPGASFTIRGFTFTANNGQSPQVKAVNGSSLSWTDLTR